MIYKHIVFRTDASNLIGTGHVMRCLTLADSLVQKGATILFICREQEGHLCDLIEERGFKVQRLPPPNNYFFAEANPAHSAWLGAPWQEDAQQVCAIIRDLDSNPDWLVVDHYAIDHRWEHFLRPLVGRIFVIDDLADRNHDCDLLLDQNLITDMHTRYNNRVAEDCSLLLGPDYALLQPIYAELHDRIPPREGPIRRILISFGGTDSDNLTGQTLAAVISLNRPDIEVDVVISTGSPFASEIQNQVVGHPNIYLYGTLPTLAPLMAKADLSIGAAGTTSWERVCLGLPSLVVTLADNQRPIAAGLHQEGLVIWLGHKDEVSVDIIRQALTELVNEGLTESWSQQCFRKVDGRGMHRTCVVLTITPETPLNVRHARVSDEAILLAWVNDPDTRRHSFSSNLISIETHQDWFRNQLRNPDICQFYIVETEERIPVGQVRFDKNNRVWEINYLLAPHFRKKGLVRPFLEAALNKLRYEYPDILVIGKVKEDILPFRKMFESLEFDSEYSRGVRFCISVCSDAASWMNAYIPTLILDWLADGHEVRWAYDAATLPNGDVCFYLSYGQIVNADLLTKHKNNLVVHESDLPKGKGWSPLTWQVLDGADSIPVTLFEASESVDSGDIYLQEWIELQGYELVEDLRRLQVIATHCLCRAFMKDYPAILKKARPQVGESTYYNRRNPIDSQLDLDRTLRSQFNLFRIADNHRYPIWFEIKNTKYRLEIVKMVNRLP